MEVSALPLFGKEFSLSRSNGRLGGFQSRFGRGGQNTPNIGLEVR
jgi:hypothetical protein